jgi:hypothetical protein
MKKGYIKALFGFILGACLSSCTTIFDDIETNGSFKPKVALPLIETQYKLTHLMQGLGVNNNLFIRPDGQFEMQYKGNFSDVRTLNFLTSLPIDIKIPAPFDPIVVVPFPHPTDMKLEYIDCKKGKFKWTMTNNNADEAMVTVTIYSLINKNNVSFEKTFPMQAGLTVTGETDLAGWRLKSTATSKLVMGYKAVVKGEEAKLADVSYDIVGLEAQQVVGYFGQIPIPLKPEELNVNFFESIGQGNDILFSDPSLAITVENGFGFPCNLKSETATITRRDGSKMAITSPLNTGVDLNYPGLNEIGQVKQTVITLNKQNSNIADIIKAHPNSIGLGLGLLVNPSITEKQSGFLTADNGLRFKMDLTLPLSPTLKNFTYYDTLNLNFSDFKHISDVEFKVITDNTLPLDLGIQAYFLTSNTIVDSLVSNNQALIVKSAQVFNGQVVGTTTQTTLINLDATKFNFVKNSTRMIVKFTASTTAQGTVPVLLKSDQSIFMRIGVRAKT